MSQSQVSGAGDGPSVPQESAEPRVVVVEDGLGRPWEPTAGLSSSARLGGSGLAVQVLAGQPEGSLFLGVGAGVLQGLPTAARATVAGRAPLTGRYGEGQVGGEFGFRLASGLDGLVLRPRSEPDSARRERVLRVEADGRVSEGLVPRADELSPAELQAALTDRFGACAALIAGRAALAGGLATVLTATSSVAPPSRVGRGGLAALLVGAGYLAVCIVAPPARPQVAAKQVGRSGTRTAAERLNALLLRSERLLERARGGSLELFEARALEAGDRTAPASEEDRRRRHGCDGCPTPCGVRLQLPSGVWQSARFGSLRALSAGGLSRTERLAELEVCDAFGLDAKEVGVALQLEEQALGRRTSPAQLRERLDRAVAGDAGLRPWLDGAAAVAEALGVPAGEALVGRESAVPEADPTRALARAVACGGSDPMRAFAFDGVLDERSVARFAPWTPGMAVWWFENHAAALDAVGFCAFSSAALLGDGLVSLNELAEIWLDAAGLENPSGAAAGDRWLALGEQIVRARRALDERWCGPRALPEGQRAELAAPELWPDYRAARGLDERGALVELSGPGPHGRAALPANFTGEANRPERVLPGLYRGPVRFSAAGELGDQLALELGGELEFRTDLPRSLGDVLESLAERAPAMRSRLLRCGRPVPGVWREARRLEACDLVQAGDRLELVSVISGG